MTKNTSNTEKKFHIDLSDSSKPAVIDNNVLKCEPLEPSPFSVSAGDASSDANQFQVASESLDTPSIPEIQETTCQVPCGAHSIFDPAQQVPAFEKALYLVLNEHSNWETGISHALSLRSLAKLTNVNSHSQVHRGLQWLIEHGWLMVEGERKSDGTYFYKVIHHKCDPQDTPVDRDGRPQKCAVPRGKGSPSQLLADGEITWKIFVDWTTRKVYSDWTTGEAEMTVREAAKLMRFTPKTIAKNAEKMKEIGLVKRLSAKFKRSVYQLFPKPYPKRKKRKEDTCVTKKAMKLIKGWFYSFNGLWRFEKDTFHLQMREDGTKKGRWIESTLERLYRINKNIHHDFSDYMRELANLNGTRLLSH